MTASSSRNRGDTNRIARIVSVAVAFVCVVGAAYLAFDWADYGTDSTCGNLVTNRKWSGPPCSDIMRNRTIVIVALVITAVVVMLAAGWWPHHPRGTDG